MNRSRIASKSSSQVSGVYSSEWAEVERLGGGELRPAHVPERHSRLKPCRRRPLVPERQQLVVDLSFGQRGRLDVVGVGAEALHQAPHQIAGVEALWIVTVVDVVEPGQPAAADRECKVVTAVERVAGVAAVLRLAEQQITHQVHVAEVAEAEVGVRVDVRDMERRSSTRASIASRQR